MVLLKDIKALDNGARFHSVDLHIHSYGGSHDVTDTLMTPDAIIDAAIRQSLIVIALTDHNSNINVQRAIDYAQEKYPGQILVLAGTEVTTAHGHLLAYFAPERTSDLAKFLSRIDLIGEMGAENTRTAKSMADTIAIAEGLGGICVAAHIDREKTGFDTFAPGFQNWKKDIIASPGLYGLECDTADSLLWYSEHDEVGSAGTERKKLLSARQAIHGLQARHNLAHIQGSDAHSMQQLEHKKPVKLWTRIKLAELSFGAFRVAMVDPTARVRACAMIPQSLPRVRGMALSGGFLHQEVIHFSDNLNCLIGGRGTGKSTAIRALAYALGKNEEFAGYGNCPDSITVYCEDINGIAYRYVRSRNGDIEVKAKEDQSIEDVPADAFRIEYFGQGELAKVAEDPLRNPELFQEFLDRHINLRDLMEVETSLITNLRENAARLNPIENLFGQLPAKIRTLEEINKKLKVAEDGNLREIVSIQSKLASEKAFREAIEKISTEYTNGFSLSGIQRSNEQIVATAGTFTDDKDSNGAISSINALISSCNNAVKQKELELNALLKTCAGELSKRTTVLKHSHHRMNNEVASKLADLKARGVATDIPGLEQLLRHKTTIAKEIAGVEQRADERKQCIEQRNNLRKELMDVRNKMTERRKAQLKGINLNLNVTIKDYTIFVKYEDAGIITEFKSFIQEKMQGTYLQENVIEALCSYITPSELAELVLCRNCNEISARTKISNEWSEKIVQKLCYWNILFELQVLAKPPKPIITVRTKTTPPKEIPVFQLSDGQRHTILLSIALLAETNVPLVIDQPEDDLDNAFIFSSIVATLRSIKERRQVILVTHNANIAVLGDSEQILPMCRENDCGKVKDRGSIDTVATRQRVLEILEGGPDAFQRRKQMYNH